MEQFVETLIWIHAGLGGLALLAGSIALISKKGKYLHRRSGRVFYWSMLISAILALVISRLPGHISPFLFAIGLFTTYLLLTGIRALRLKKQNVSLNIDRLISRLMFGIGMLMVYGGLLGGIPLLGPNTNILMPIFGVLAIFLAVGDLRSFSKPDSLRKSWLRLHLTKMTGAYIAAVTAFIVVNQAIPGILGWILPSVVGTIFIVLSIRKLKLN